MSTTEKTKIIVLVGPTAIGKTNLSLHIAEEFGCEIISMDSMQIYKYMDIGTAKPTSAERERVPHHLIDFVDPEDLYNVSRYISDAWQVIETLRSQKKLPMFVGGTGLYMKALLDGLFTVPSISVEVRNTIRNMLDEKGSSALHEELQRVDPASASRIHAHDKQRVARALEIYEQTGLPWSAHLERHQENASRKSRAVEAIKIGLNCERDILYHRINRRSQLMLEQGLVEEVEGLLGMGYSPELQALQSIGYKHAVNYLQKKWTIQETLEFLARDTRRYAKRQLTWFGRDREISWFHPEDIDGVRDVLVKAISP